MVEMLSKTYRSHACAILVCAFVPTLMTFIGKMPGMVGGGWPADWPSIILRCRNKERYAVRLLAG